VKWAGPDQGERRHGGLSRGRFAASAGGLPSPPLCGEKGRDEGASSRESELVENAPSPGPEFWLSLRGLGPSPRKRGEGSCIEPTSPPCPLALSRRMLGDMT